MQFKKLVATYHCMIGFVLRTLGVQKWEGENNYNRFSTCLHIQTCCLTRVLVHPRIRLCRLHKYSLDHIELCFVQFVRPSASNLTANMETGNPFSTEKEEHDKASMHLWNSMCGNLPTSTPLPIAFTARENRLCIHRLLLKRLLPQHRGWSTCSCRLKIPYIVCIL